MTEPAQERANQEERETYVRYLYERITELHRDKERRWPGVTARHQAGEEWAKVKKGEALDPIPQREGYASIPPTTYRLKTDA